MQVVQLLPPLSSDNQSHKRSHDILSTQMLEIEFLAPDPNGHALPIFDASGCAPL